MIQSNLGMYTLNPDICWPSVENPAGKGGLSISYHKVYTMYSIHCHHIYTGDHFFKCFIICSRWSGKPEPWMIEKHGGLEDFVVDPFGFKYQVEPDHHHDGVGDDEVDQCHQLCGPDGGFTSAGRDSLLFQVIIL